MPRGARKISEQKTYHIMLRGNNRANIFIDEEDKLKAIKVLEEKKKVGEYLLYAYCVMDNHIHLIIKEGNNPISYSIKRIASSYSYYFNKKYKRIGHIFQERFKSENIENERYLLAAIRYVHQNPTKPGIGTINNYNWSSYRDYIGEGLNITDTEEILNIFSSSKEKAKAEFAKFSYECADETFLDISERSEIDHNNVEAFIYAYLGEKGVNIINLKDKEHKLIRVELVKLLIDKSNISLRGIAAILGLRREMVRSDASFASRAGVSREGRSRGQAQ